MEITAALVKELRERTGSGLMECKKVLQETCGNIEQAILLMRKLGTVKADQKANRKTAEGLIGIHYSENYITMVEVNCETDFVSRNKAFRSFVRTVTETILIHKPVNIEALLYSKTSNGIDIIEQCRQDCVAQIGENINVRRFVLLHQTDHRQSLGSYLHSNFRIGVLVKLEGGNQELAKDIAMHIAASNPLCISQEEVPKELINTEREIYTAQAKSSTINRSTQVIEKIVEGKLRKYLESVTLLGQKFVKDQNHTISALLNIHQAQVLQFQRFEIGEN